MLSLRNHHRADFAGGNTQFALRHSNAGQGNGDGIQLLPPRIDLNLQHAVLAHRHANRHTAAIGQAHRKVLRALGFSLGLAGL